MPMTFDDDECYQLFLAIDDRARALPEKKPVQELRDKLLPIYRQWHADHPHRVHPSCYR